MNVISDYSNLWPYNAQVDPVPDYSLYERNSEGLPALNYDYIGILSFEENTLQPYIETNESTEFVSIFTTSPKGTALYRVKDSRQIKITGAHATGITYTADACSDIPIEEQQGTPISVFICSAYLVPPRGGAYYDFSYAGLRNCLPLDQFTAKDGATGEMVVDLTGNPMVTYYRNAPIPPGTYLLGSSKLNIFAVNKIVDCLIAGVEGYPQYSSFTKKVVLPLFPKELEALKAAGYDVTITGFEVATFTGTNGTLNVAVKTSFDKDVSVLIGDVLGSSGETILASGASYLDLSVSPPCVTSCEFEASTEFIDTVWLTLPSVEDFFTSIKLKGDGYLRSIKLNPSKHNLSTFSLRGKTDVEDLITEVISDAQLLPTDLFDQSVQLLDRADIPNIYVFIASSFEAGNLTVQQVVDKWIVAFCDGYMTPSVYQSPAGTKVTLAMPIAEYLTPALGPLVATWCFEHPDLLFIDLNPINRFVGSYFIATSSLGESMVVHFNATDYQITPTVSLDFSSLGQNFHYIIVGEDSFGNPLIIDQTGHVNYNLPHDQASSLTIAWPYKNFVAIQPVQ